MVLVGSLLALIGFARAGSVLFWKCEADRGEREPDRPSNDTAGICAVAALVAGPVLLALFAGPAMTAMDATARQLFTPQRYIEAVLGSGVDVGEGGAMTRRFLPHPRLSLFVALIWLALVNEISAGAVVMGVALGVLMPILTGPFWPDPPALRRPLKMLEYCGVVAWDIVLANLQVARLILLRPQRPAALALRHRAAGPDLARGDHRARRHHHHDPGHGQRRALGRRPRPPGPRPRRARPGSAGGRDQVPLRGAPVGDLPMIEWAVAIGTWAVAAAMLLNLYRLALGPDIADRVLALDTLSVNAVALIVLIDIALGSDLYFEAALLIAMIGFVSTVAFCKYVLRGDVIE